TSTPASAAVTATYDFVRLHDTLYRKIRGGVYVGGGLMFDTHTGVKPSDDDEPLWQQSPYVAYSNAHGLPIESQQSAGLSANVLVDKRRGEIDPLGGWMAAAAYRQSWNGAFGDSAWNSLHVEARAYAPVRTTRSRLALWLFGEFSGGTIPYFDLPT